ncbi:hypothetical protein [Streptococcus halotolerans]|uniref:hypothetical protein n=1 Tax=Streptococcus halotolerans TaxID=1814128 RepID=UPI0007869505|nr:hypothetical protein [Streptococcus halotolerans]
MGKIRQPLADKILENSVSKHLPTAIKEWQSIAKIHNEIDDSIRCLCGTRGIKDWYELINAKNGKRLVHIGANCITYFTAATDYLPAKEVKKLGHLKRLASHQQLPEFTKTYFSRPLLTYFLENDVFRERPENNFHAFNDYKRLKDFIYKGGRKEAHSSEEFAQLIQLWTDYIKPFLLEEERPEISIESISQFSNDNEYYLQQIKALQAENERLRQALELQTSKHLPKAKKHEEAPLLPDNYQTLQTLCRRRKNRRNLRLDDLSLDILNYWQSIGVLSSEEKTILATAMQTKGPSLSYQLYQKSQVLLETLTNYMRKR